MTKKQITKRTKFWQNKLGLTNWDVEALFEEFERDNDTPHATGVAMVECNSQYKYATIRYRISQLDQVNDAVILHELLHALTSPLIGFVRANKKAESWLDYFDEQIVSELERIIMRIYKKS